MSVGALLSLAVAGLMIYVFLAAFEGDTDAYGGVGVPGQATADLPSGQIDLFYEQSVGPRAAGFTVPEGLRITVTDEAGQDVETSSRGGDPEEVPGGMAQVISSVSVPAEGRYRIQVDAESLAGRVRPRVTLGQSPYVAIKERFDSVVDRLVGPIGIAIVLGLLLLYMVGRVRNAQRRKRALR